MSEERIHRTIADDGTEIAGRVHGQGPVLVFVHGIIADGGLDWTPLVRRLADRFTCYECPNSCPHSSAPERRMSSDPN